MRYKDIKSLKLLLSVEHRKRLSLSRCEAQQLLDQAKHLGSEPEIVLALEDILRNRDSVHSR